MYINHLMSLGRQSHSERYVDVSVIKYDKIPPPKIQTIRSIACLEYCIYLFSPVMSLQPAIKSNN